MYRGGRPDPWQRRGRQGRRSQSGREKTTTHSVAPGGGGGDAPCATTQRHGSTMSSDPITSTGLAITIRDVGAQFAASGGAVEALAGCSLEIAAGSFTVII